MRKIFVPVLSLLVLLAFCVVFSSCKEDEPFVKPKLSFAVSTLTVNEADDIIEIEVVLDKPAPEDITIDYSLDGTALDKVTSGDSYDYEILSDYLEIQIDKGETTGIIEIQLYSDLEIEDPELIDIQLEDVDSEKIEITRDDRMKITVEQEDGIVVLLQWGVGEGENYTDVDMDLFLWAENTSGTLVLTGLGSTAPSFSPPEAIFLPTIALEDGTYGLSYNYYEGTVEPMNFEVIFAEFINGDFEPEAQMNIFSGSYTLANINPWYTSEVDPLLSQTFKKTGSVYSDFSEITIPASGSRTSVTNKLSTLRISKQNKVQSEKLKSFLRK